jgi:uncharacterized protein (TIGR02145 family)
MEEKMKKSLLCLLICMITLTACADDDNSFNSSDTPTYAKRCKTENEDLCEYGVLTDFRDGQSYKTVKIGTQWWMAENLNFESVNSYCLDDDVVKCAKYGRIYIWSAALSACPEGWHLPTIDEFNILDKATRYSIDALTSNSISCGRRLKCSDSYGFSVIPAGYITYNGDFGLSYEFTSFWSSSDYDFLNAYEIILDFFNTRVYSRNFIKYSGMSVRCLKGEATSVNFDSSSHRMFVNPNETTKGTFIDSRDGLVYKTVTIGNQTWMAENLNYETSNTECLKNDTNNCNIYGRLYPWKEAMISCPFGWHLPSLDEWYLLFDAVGDLSSVAIKLKSITGWNLGFNGTDDFSFSVLPAGYGGDVSDFNLRKDGAAFFWTSTGSEFDDKGGYAGFAKLIWFRPEYSRALQNYMNMEATYSVRCLQD